MAKLPRSPISVDVQNNYRPVREARASGADPVGQALEGAGNAGFEIASRIADANIAAEATQADIGLRSDLDKLRRELEADNETPPEQLEGIYRERAGKIVADRTGAMQSPALRRAFSEQSARALETGVINVRDVTRRKQVSGVRAKALTAFAMYEDLIKDPGSFDKGPNGEPSAAEEARDGNIKLANQSFKSGTWDADTAEEMRLKAQATYEVGLANAHVFKIGAMLDSGDPVQIANADAYFLNNSGDLSTEQAMQVRDLIDAKKNYSAAVGEADAIRAAHPGDLTSQLAAVREIKDPEKRKTVMDFVIAENTRDTAATNANQNSVRMQGLEPLLNGGGLGSIPSAVMMQADADTKRFWKDYDDQQRARAQSMATMSAEQKAALKAYETNVVGAITSLRGSDPDLYKRGPRVWMSEDRGLYESFVALDENAKAKIEREIADFNTGGGKASVADGLASQIMGGSTTYGVDLTAMKTDNPERYRQLVGAVQNAAEREAINLGEGDLTTTRRKEIFGAELAKVLKEEGAAGGFRPFGLPVGPLAIASELDASTEERRRALDIAALLPSDYRAARAKLIDKGNPNPSEMEVATEALSMRAKRDAREAAPVFTQGNR